VSPPACGYGPARLAVLGADYSLHPTNPPEYKTLFKVSSRMTISLDDLESNGHQRCDIKKNVEVSNLADVL